LQPLTVPRPRYEDSFEELKVDLAAPPPLASDVATAFPHNTPGPVIMDDFSTGVYVDQQNTATKPDSPFAETSEPVELLVAAVESSERQHRHRFSRPPITRRAVDQDRSGHVLFNQTGQFDVDYAAELSAAISMRMKPPPMPETDLRLISIAAVMGLLAIVLSWGVGVFSTPKAFVYTGFVAGALIVFAVCWRAALAGKGGRWSKALMALLPPVSLVLLFRKSEGVGYRPLMILGLGLLGVGLMQVGPLVHQQVQTNPTLRTETVQAEPTDQVERLRSATRIKDHDQVLALLQLLKDPKSLTTVSEKDQAELPREIGLLLVSDRAPIRTAALQAALVWNPSEGQRFLALWLKSYDPQDRQAAIALAVKVPHADVTRLLIDNLNEPDFQELAKKSLLSLGNLAEPFLLKQLQSTQEQKVLIACDVLRVIGTMKSLEELDTLARSTSSRTIREECLASATELRQRLAQQE
jgi:hypothetical protein